MDIIFLKIGLFLFSYILGSIPNGLFIGKIFLKINLNEHGSKNIGASNAIRVLGLKLGLLTLFLDTLKGAIPILLGKYLFPNVIADFNNLITLFGKEFDYVILYGLTATLGHTFSIFLKFKGGKAVAPSLGVVLTITPVVGVIVIIIYFSTVAITHYASVASTLAALGVGFGALIQFLIMKNLVQQLFVFLIYWLMIIIIFIRHIPNYKRLIKNEERKTYFKKK